jgi:hypothetical protein
LAFLDQAAADLTMLGEGCNKHRSVDTFAKMLYLTSNIEERAAKYKKVKCAIVLFFELFRFYSDKTDKRYDAFLATILRKNNPKFPNDINILSWNYDFEFERAYLNYSPEKENIHELYRDLNIIHKNSKAAMPIGNNFGIIKINGTAGFYNKNSGELTLGLDCHTKKNIGIPHVDNTRLIEICKSYDKYINGYEPAISFSWDDDIGTINTKDQIRAAMSNTQIFIIIGYSFPYFNRDIDKFIIDGILYGNTKVYVQDKKANELLDTIKEIRDYAQFKYKPISNCDQFYMGF